MNKFKFAVGAVLVLIIGALLVTVLKTSALVKEQKEALTTLQQDKNDLQQKFDTINTEKKAFEEQKIELNNKIEELNKQIEELKISRANRKSKNHNMAADAYSYKTADVKAAIDTSTPIADKKLAFLTFDDGPNTTITTQILDLLKSAQVPATFFIPGAYVNDETAEVLKREYAEGHAIAAHSFSHDYGVLYPGRSANATAITQEALAAQARFQKYLPEGFSTAVWRYPGGKMSWANTAASDEALREVGMEWIDWNVMTGDAEPKHRRPDTADGLVAYLENDIAKKGSPSTIVVLMHDATTKQLTVDALPRVIEFLKAQGYEFGILG